MKKRFLAGAGVLAGLPFGVRLIQVRNHIHTVVFDGTTGSDLRTRYTLDQKRGLSPILTLSAAPLFRGTVSILVSLAICVMGWPAAAAPVVIPRDDHPPEAERLTSRAPAMLEIIRELRALIDRSRFDPQAVLDRADYDDREIVAWVKERIAYEPYAGVLRGVEGTLGSGAGNSADQSLLLASLLRDAGFEARIVQGALSPAGGDRLREEIFRRPSNETDPPIPLEEAKAVIARFADRVGMPRKEIEKAMGEAADRQGSPEFFRFEQKVEETVAVLQEAVGSHMNLDPVPIAWPPEKYYWVEYRLAPGDPWHAAHPSLHDPAHADFAPEFHAYHAKQMPAETVQTFRLEVHVERRIGDKIQRTPLMDPWERPAANLYGKLLQFQLIPDTLFGTNLLEAPEAMADWRYAVPFLNGTLPAGGKAVSRRGLIAPASIISQPQAGVFKEFSDKASKAVEALGNLGSKEEQSLLALERIVLTYTVATPKRTLTEQRVIFEGPVEENGRIAVPLRSEALLLNTGRYPEALVLDRLLAETEGQLKMLSEVRPIEAGYQVPQEAALERPVAEHLALYHLFDKGAARVADPAVYRAIPNLVSIHGEMDLEEGLGTGGKGIDIVFNDRRAIRAERSRVVHDRRSAMRVGVWESFAEDAFLELASPVPKVQSASGALYSGASGGYKLHMNGGSISFSDKATHVDQKMAYAYPVKSNSTGNSKSTERPLLDSPKWRLNLNHGTVLAVDADGRGAVVTEHITTREIVKGAVVLGAACTIFFIYLFGDAFNFRDGLACFAYGFGLTSQVAWRLGLAVGLALARFFSRALDISRE